MPRFSNPQRKRLKHRTPNKHNNCKCQKKPIKQEEKKVAINAKIPSKNTAKIPPGV